MSRLTTVAVLMTFSALASAQCVEREVPKPADPAVVPAGGPAPVDLPPPVVAEPLPPIVVLDVSPADGGSSKPPSEPEITGTLKSSDEYLLWWLKPGPLPVLGIRSRGGPPILGAPGTRTVIGPDTIDLGEQGGARFTTSFQVCESKDYGLQLGYFFLGTRTTTLLAAATADGNSAFIGRPYVDAATGREAVDLVAEPGVRTGELRAASSARAQGTEVNLLAGLCRCPHWQLDALAGYRFLMIHEGLHVWEQSIGFDAAGATYRVRTDQFVAHNRFHGGQVGLIGDLRHGPVFLGFVGKIGFGQVTQVVKAGGQTGTMRLGEVGTVTPGGFYALSTNAGRQVREAFAVLPEAQVKLGVALGDHGRLFVGYDFLFLSDAVRPGDQIDLVLNRTGDPLGPERPTLAGRSTDLWLQGLTIGVETRW